jgi:hypothetical protein
MTFTTDRELREYMVSNSVNAIDRMVETARRHAITAFGEVSQPEPTRAVALEDEYNMITLPDGTVARIRNESSIS